MKLGYTILEDGSVSKPVVLQSSGYPDLDAAAIAAASTWRYKPATKNGAAVAAPWQTQVVFKLDDPQYPPYMAMNIVDMPASEYPPDSRAAHAGGDTWLLVTIGENGIVTGAVLARSSGVPGLDAAAMLSALRWHFTGATRDGHPLKTIVMIDARWTPPPDSGSSK